MVLNAVKTAEIILNCKAASKDTSPQQPLHAAMKVFENKEVAVQGLCLDKKTKRKCFLLEPTCIFQGLEGGS